MDIISLKVVRSYLSVFSLLIFMLIVTSYTLINHMINGFSEEAGHWVMWPFFKDHTSYGAILICIPINIWLIYSSENKIKKTIVFLIDYFFVGLYFAILELHG